MLIILYAVVFCLPAFIITLMEDSIFDFMEMAFFTLIGFPGTALAIIVRLIIGLCKGTYKILEDQRREAEIQEYAQKRAIQEEQQRRTSEAERKRYEAELQNKRYNIFPNSRVIKELLELIRQVNCYPYEIEIKSNGVWYSFEGFAKEYIFRAHNSPDLNSDEEKIFASVLNEKLGNRYTIKEESKIHSFTHYDGEPGFTTVHISTKLLLKVTGSF